MNGSHTELLLRVGERFGLPIVLCLLILWWARNDIVQPLLDAHFQVIGQIVEGQRMHTDKLDTLGRKLDELIRVTEKR